ncbi:MAG: hypothetical protein K6C99_07145, partial [Lachnospiraceae bacterium]|nr:hypothetical protein [Lachnospiraceae bacterium]
MEEKKYLLGFINKSLRKINTGVMIRNILNGLIAGLFVAALIEGASAIWPVYYAHLFAGIAAVLGLIGGTILGILKKKKEADAALLIDGFGLKERVVTAYDHLEEKDIISNMQRADAAACLKEMEPSIKIKMNIGVRRILLFVCMLLLAIATSLLPSPVKNVAAEKHEVKKEAVEKEKEIEKAVEALEKIDRTELTENERQELSDMLESLQSSSNEMKNVANAQDLQSASQRLDYKYADIANGLNAMQNEVESRKEQEKKEKSGNSGKNSASENKSNGGAADQIAGASKQIEDNLKKGQQNNGGNAQANNGG